MKRKELMEEFKSFAFKDTTIATAIGLMVGSALSNVINSLIKNIFTPPLGYITSGIDFSNMYLVLGKNTYDSLQEALDAEAVVISYGTFLNDFISFVITALILFLIVMQLTKVIKKRTDKAERSTKVCPYCKMEIHKDATKCPYCISKV